MEERRGKGRGGSLRSLEICGILSASKRIGKTLNGAKYSFSLAKAWSGGRVGRTGDIRQVNLVEETGRGSIVPFTGLSALAGASLCLHHPQLSPLSSSMLSLSLEAKCGAEATAGIESGGPCTSCSFRAPHPQASAATGSQGPSRDSHGSFACLLLSGQSSWLSYLTKATLQTLALVPTVPK